MSRSYDQLRTKVRAHREGNGTTRGLIALILALTVGVATSGTTPAPAAPPEAGSVRERLAQTKVSIDLDGVMFSKVIDQFRADHHLNIYVNERALAAAGVGRDTRITLRLQDVPLADALELLLRDAGGDKAPLNYVVENEVVVVSTGAETTERPVTRLYDVTDLLDSGYARRRLLNTPLLALKLTGDESQGAESAGGGSASQNPFSGGEQEEKSAAGMLQDDSSKLTTFERLDSLMELFRDTVYPEVWTENGGRSTIHRERNRLVVSAGVRVHQDIEDLLTLLRTDVPKIVDLHWTLFHVDREALGNLEAKAGSSWPRLAADAAVAVEREFAGEGLVTMTATTTGPSGRGQFVSSLRQQDYIATFQPVVDAYAVAYQPRIEQANTGVELIVLPIVAHDGRILTLDVSLALAAPDEIKEQRCGTTTVTREPEMTTHDVAVQLRTAELRTVLSRLRLEQGQAVVLSIPYAPESGSPPQEHTLLLLRPTVH